MTTVGKNTPEDMKSGVVQVASPAEAAHKAISLLSDPAAIERISARGSAYAERFSWKIISEKHRTIYEQSLQ